MKVLLEHGTYGKVIAVYPVKDKGTIPPKECIERDDLNLGDELKEDGTIIRYVPPTPPIPPTPPPTIEDQIYSLKLSNKMQEVKLELINDALVEGGLL